MSLAREVLKAKKQELLSQIADLRKGLRDIDAALEVLEPPASGLIAERGLGGSTVNDAIIQAVSHGNGTPAAIYNFIINETTVDTSKNSVSTRLSKLKNDGLLDHDGEKWILPKKIGGSDASTSEPAMEKGPVTGRERGYPPSAPEGSIPSGSTASHPPPSRDLDDEIPF